MKKILHLFRSSQFTEGYVYSLNKYCMNSKHCFIIYGTFFLTAKCEYIRENNVRYVKYIEYELKKPGIFEYFNSFDMIIYHGVFEQCVINFFFKNPLLEKKLFLYFWGGDIPLLETDEDNMVKRLVIKEARGIITIVDSDYKKIVDIYHPKGVHVVIKYADERQLKHMKEDLYPYSRNGKKKVYIQIGNSATETNRHIEILKELEKYKDEAISIFLPLAYGNPEYARKVVDFAEETFGNKIIVLSEMLSIEEYISKLKEIDVAIFAMSRQQALGNVQILGMNGCKLYVKRKEPLDMYLSNTLGCHVAYIDEIDEMNFAEFISLPLNKQLENREKILHVNEMEYKMNKWNALFDEE